MRNRHAPRRALSIVRRFFAGVETVEDAKRDAIIEVTAQDSRVKHVRDHKTCALAWACQKKLGADGVIVGTRTAYVVFGSKAIRFRLQETTAREIVSFDRHADFAPGEYELKAPSKWEALGHKTSGKTHNPSDRKTPAFRHKTTGIRTVLGAGHRPKLEEAA